jgi:hypothetical protein
MSVTATSGAECPSALGLLPRDHQNPSLAIRQPSLTDQPYRMNRNGRPVRHSGNRHSPIRMSIQNVRIEDLLGEWG